MQTHGRQALSGVIRPKQFLFVAEDANGLLGFVIAMRISAPTITVTISGSGPRSRHGLCRSHCVSQQARGQGIGAKLYSYLAELAAGSDCQTMTAEMDIDPPNEHSVYFHKKADFRRNWPANTDSGKQVDAVCRTDEQRSDLTLNPVVTTALASFRDLCAMRYVVITLLALSVLITSWSAGAIEEYLQRCPILGGRSIEIRDYESRNGGTDMSEGSNSGFEFWLATCAWW